MPETGARRPSDRPNRNSARIDLQDMLLYLIRHADAVDLAPDAGRPLSPRGREQVEALGRFLLRSAAFHPTEIWHSTLRRARETAVMLSDGLKLKVPLHAVPGLEPAAAPQLVARRASLVRHDLAVVGHEPHLGMLATLLVTGGAERTSFVVKKGTVIALERDGSNWLVRWQVSPGLLG
jgi:phosphohistidine phosphatase